MASSVRSPHDGGPASPERDRCSRSHGRRHALPVRRNTARSLGSHTSHLESLDVKRVARPFRRATTSCPAIAPHQDLTLYSDRITRVVDHRNELHAPRERARLSSVSSLRQILAAVSSIAAVSRHPEPDLQTGWAWPSHSSPPTAPSRPCPPCCRARGGRSGNSGCHPKRWPAGGRVGCGSCSRTRRPPAITAAPSAAPGSTRPGSPSIRSAGCRSWTGRSSRSRAKTRFSPCRARG